MKRGLFASAIALVGLVFVLEPAVQGQDKDKKDEKPKYTISEVMKKAHAKGTLLDKVKAGTATDAEKTELTAMYVALAANTPPKGEADSWKKKTTAILEAYKSGDVKALSKATACGACHKEFKAK